MNGSKFVHPVDRLAEGAFHAYNNDGTFVLAGDGTFRKVKLDGEEIDVSGWFDTANWRFVPQKAGIYQLNAMAAILDLLNAGDNGSAAIFKNGVEHRRLTRGETASADVMTQGGSAIVQANGTTDFFELFLFFSTSGGITRRILSGPSLTWLSGHYIGRIS